MVWLWGFLPGDLQFLAMVLIVWVVETQIKFVTMRHRDVAVGASKYKWQSDAVCVPRGGQKEREKKVYKLRLGVFDFDSYLTFLSSAASAIIIIRSYKSRDHLSQAYTKKP